MLYLIALTNMLYFVALTNTLGASSTRSKVNSQKKKMKVNKQLKKSSKRKKKQRLTHTHTYTHTRHMMESLYRAILKKRFVLSWQRSREKEEAAPFFSRKKRRAPVTVGSM